MKETSQKSAEKIHQPGEAPNAAGSQHDPGEFNEPVKVTSPRGEVFDLIGPAGPVRFKRAPSIPTEAAEDLLVIKEGALFLCSRRNGDIRPRVITGEGLYTQDTRFLSEFQLTLGGTSPILLSASADLAYAMVIDMTNRNIREDKTLTVGQQTLSLRRFRLLGERLYERIKLRNYGNSFARTTLELSMAADFADTFEVRGFRKRKTRGNLLVTKPAEKGLNFAYVGEDKVFRETLVDFSVEPEDLSMDEGRAVATWNIALDPDPEAEFEILVSVEPSAGGKRCKPRTLEAAEEKVAESHNRWRSSGTQVHSDNKVFDNFVRASSRDLRALATPVNSESIIAAGIPWYVAPFGRDALLATYSILMFNPIPARDALRLLARYQSKVDDPWRDAEPGKIMHEIRTGELAGAGIIPHTPYYGSVDSTPLFLMLAAAYYRWTADMPTMTELLPSLDAALKWIDDYGDQDGDGFVEYERRSVSGMTNQGWKDSEDGVPGADGSMPEPPIALVEVQGYVYMAKLRIAGVYDAFGAHDKASRLRKEARELRRAFNEAFWMPDEGMFAVALDGQKRQVKSITSNPGHCLYCAIVDADKAASLVQRLMAPDMYSGWGIRTLSSKSPAYNPMSYHNGSVWPHDNAIIAAGFKRYGFADATERVATALFDAANVNRESRLPELLCGFNRREGIPFVSYPVACSPQAWSTAVPFLLMQAMLGLSANAPERLLTINHPRMPDWLKHLEMQSIQIGDCKLSLAFTREDRRTSFALREREGHMRVMIEE